MKKKDPNGPGGDPSAKDYADTSRALQGLDPDDSTRLLDEAPDSGDTLTPSEVKKITNDAQITKWFDEGKLTDEEVAKLLEGRAYYHEHSRLMSKTEIQELKDGVDARIKAKPKVPQAPKPPAQRRSEALAKADGKKPGDSSVILLHREHPLDKADVEYTAGNYLSVAYERNLLTDEERGVIHTAFDQKKTLADDTITSMIEVVQLRLHARVDHSMDEHVPGTPLLPGTPASAKPPLPDNGDDFSLDEITQGLGEKPPTARHSATREITVPQFELYCPGTQEFRRITVASLRTSSDGKGLTLRTMEPDMASITASDGTSHSVVFGGDKTRYFAPRSVEAVDHMRSVIAVRCEGCINTQEHIGRLSSEHVIQLFREMGDATSRSDVPWEKFLRSVIRQNANDEAAELLRDVPAIKLWGIYSQVQDKLSDDDAAQFVADIKARKRGKATRSFTVSGVSTALGQADTPKKGEKTSADAPANGVKATASVQDAPEPVTSQKAAGPTSGPGHASDPSKENKKMTSQTSEPPAADEAEADQSDDLPNDPQERVLIEIESVAGQLARKGLLLQSEVTSLREMAARPEPAQLSETQRQDLIKMVQLRVVEEIAGKELCELARQDKLVSNEIAMIMTRKDEGKVMTEEERKALLLDIEKRQGPGMARVAMILGGLFVLILLIVVGTAAYQTRDTVTPAPSTESAADKPIAVLAGAPMVAEKEGNLYHFRFRLVTTDKSFSRASLDLSRPGLRETIVEGSGTPGAMLNRIELEKLPDGRYRPILHVTFTGGASKRDMRPRLLEVIHADL